MKKNIGTTDKIIRIILAVVLAILFFTGVVSGTFGIILLIIAAVLLMTSLVGYCGLYSVLGVSTCPLKTEEKKQ
ncbi:MAG: DUF2892 domain-containing protein [Ignavibacteria bacterium]|nr:DUF2892 domain-containing protein [Ignavibacteria bacterium]